jgi:hypothetical protein
MTQRCRVCTHPDHKTIDDLLLSGVPDRHVAKQFGIETVSVGRHRRNHLLAPKIVEALDRRLRQNKIERQAQRAVEAYDKGDSKALALASLSLTAQATKIVEVEGWVKSGVAHAMKTGALNALAPLAGTQLRAVEVGSKLAGTGGYRPPSVLPQGVEKATVSIEMIFQGAGKTESINLAGRPVIDGDKIDPSATDGVDLPSPHPNQQLQRDEEGKTAGAYWSFDKLLDAPSDNETNE